MNIKLNFKFGIAFIALLFVMHEAHEIVHTTVGRIICGDWGLRDFNLWELSEGCSENTLYKFLPTLAGPFFTFVMIWWGTSFLKKTNSTRKKSFGFALIFANMPLARIFTAAMGSGDEVYTLSNLWGNHTLARAVGFIAILLITAYPLYKAFVTIERNRIAWFLLFFILPMVIDLLVVLGLMNTLLQDGLLDHYWILGSPVLVTLWTGLMVLLLLMTYNYLYTLGTAANLNKQTNNA